MPEPLAPATTTEAPDGPLPGGDAKPYLWASVRLSLGTASALGLARFAYGLLLPAMRSDLHWSLGDAGVMTTVNGLGYLVGAGATAVYARRWNPTATFRIGMLLTTLSLVANAASGGFAPLMVARAAAGFGGALVFITGGVIAARIAAKAKSAAPIMIYFSGAGLGIVISGAAIPPLLDHAADRWPAAWIGLAIGAALATAASWTAARTDAPMNVMGESGNRTWQLWRTALAYLLFAAGYIAYITFLSATLADRHSTTWQVALVWALLGISVMAAPRLWNRPLSRWPAAHNLTAMLVLLVVASVIPLFSSALPVIIISAIAYGASFMAVPAAVTAFIRTTTPPAEWPRTLAAFTILFAAGQTVGPWAAGAIADHTGSSATLVWTAVLCAASALIAVTERTRGTEQS